MPRYMIRWRCVDEPEHRTFVSADEAAVALGLLVCGAELNDQHTEFFVSCAVPDAEEESETDLLRGPLRR